jgi:exodeoxyribonuclease VII small subunit
VAAVPDPTSADPTDVTGTSGARPTYEQAREELVEVVRRLETGAATLEESLALWERGETLAGICQEWLDGARARLDEAVARDGGGTGQA